MYRIAKTLNHNSFIGVEEGNNREYLVMGKGIAFGTKTGQRVQIIWILLSGGFRTVSRSAIRSPTISV